MLTTNGDLWTVDAGWQILPMNLIVQRDSRAAMGAGVALEASQRYPDLAARLGMAIKNLRWAPLARPVTHFRDHRLSCLPTKYEWRERSNLDLIRRGLVQLSTIFRPLISPVRLPCPRSAAVLAVYGRARYDRSWNACWTTDLCWCCGIPH